MEFFAVHPKASRVVFFRLHPFGLMELVFFCCCCPAGAFWTRCSMPGEPITQKTLWTPGVDSKNNSRNRARGKRGNNNTNKKDRPRGGWCLFFCSRPAPMLTHSLRAWAATLPGPGRVFLVWLRPRRTRRANKEKRLVCIASGLKRCGGTTAKKTLLPSRI